MVTGRAALPCLLVMFSLVFAASAMAQGKKKPSSYVGTADFRCEGTGAGCPGFPNPDDGVLGQVTLENPDATYPGSGVPESGRGAHLRPGNEMWIGLREGFTVRLDFSRRVADPAMPCQPGVCQYENAFGLATSVVIGESSFGEIQSNVIDGDDITPSLMDVSTDSSNPSPVRLFFAFYDAGGRLWNFNFSDARNSGSENASVHRVPATCTWVFTDGGSLAELSTLVRIAGKQIRSYEGLYTAPFELTFTASNCPLP